MPFVPETGPAQLHQTNRIDYELERENDLMDDLSSIIADLEQQRDAIHRALDALRGIGENKR